MPKSRSKTVVRYVRAKRSRGRAKMTLPLAVIAGFAPLAMWEMRGLKRLMAGDQAGGTQEMVIRATGYNTDTRAFHWDVFMESYGPILVGFVVHKLASRLGVNRAMAKAGIPFVRI